MDNYTYDCEPNFVMAQLARLFEEQKRNREFFIQKGKTP